MSEGMSLEQQLPKEEWKKPRENFHLDPRKLGELGDAAPSPEETMLQTILDQISLASREELGVIEKNIATAIQTGKTTDEDPVTVAKIVAVFKRSQELAGNDLEKPQTLH